MTHAEIVEALKQPPRPRDVYAERTKVCAGPCGRTLPVSQFPARKRWPNGEVRWPGSECKRCRAERSKVERLRYDREAIVDRGGLRLPIAPWLSWLRGELGRPGMDKERLAKRLGLDSRVVRSWLIGERKSITVDMADRALVHDGRPDLLHTLWPDIDALVKDYLR